jgi:hypothetical protein
VVGTRYWCRRWYTATTYLCTWLHTEDGTQHRYYLYYVLRTVVGGGTSCTTYYVLDVLEVLRMQWCSTTYYVLQVVSLPRIPVYLDTVVHTVLYYGRYYLYYVLCTATDDGYLHCVQWYSVPTYRGGGYLLQLVVCGATYYVQWYTTCSASHGTTYSRYYVLRTEGSYYLYYVLPLRTVGTTY